MKAFKINIGTRKSELAMWQANYVANILKINNIESNIIAIDTKGDKNLEVSIPSIGSKGVFTEELEDMLENQEIDIAVHSAKDLESEMYEDFDILAFTQRENPMDVIISNKKIDVENGSFSIGTSSTRRISFIKRFFPNITIKPMRGNLQTRMAKMEKEKQCDALMLAFAGINRLGLTKYIKHELEVGVFTPAVGQGSLAIECHESLASDKKKAIRMALNDENTEICIKAERKFLEMMDGGCSIPIFALATIEGKSIKLQGGIISLDGEKLVRKTVVGFNPMVVGEQLYHKVAEAGGMDILKEIKKQIKY